MIIEAGIQILNALINGIIQVLSQLIEAAFQLIMALIDALVTNLPLILGAGIQILTALVDGIITMLPFEASIAKPDERQSVHIELVTVMERAKRSDVGQSAL